MSADHESVRELIIRAGSANHEWFGGEWTGGYRIQQDPDELASLIVSLLSSRHRYESILEIGSAHGGTARIFWDALKPNYLITIDSDPLTEPARRELLPTGVHLTLDSRSRACRAVLRDLKRRFDLIHIDADHSYDAVRADLLLARHFARIGGLIVLHDVIMLDGPGQVWREIGENRFARVRQLHQIGGRFGFGVAERWR